MFNRVSEWLDVVLETDIPAEVVAFGFNLYEDEQPLTTIQIIPAALYLSIGEGCCQIFCI